MSSAIIIIDYQNEFVHSRGKLHNDVGEIMKKNGMSDKVPRVIHAARDAGALVIHCPVVMTSGARFQDEEYDPHSYSTMGGLFTEGSWNGEFSEGAKPENGDIVLKNRSNFSAFKGTDLETILMRHGIQQLFVMGFLSNVCIEETVREASEILPNLTLYVCSDGTAAKSEDEYYNSVSITLPLYSKVITCSEAQDLLKISPPPISLPNEKENEAVVENLLPRRSELGPDYRPRILALHGAKSNNDVTRLQLENLHITEKDYDIVYLHGHIEVEEGDPSLTGLVHGPFYSWIDDVEAKIGESLVTAISDTLTVVEAFGPFDGIYGFSSGGTIAALASNVASDPVVQAAVIENKKNGKLIASRVSVVRTSRNRRGSAMSTAGPSRNRRGSMVSINRRGSMVSITGTSRDRPSFMRTSTRLPVENSTKLYIGDSMNSSPRSTRRSGTDGGFFEAIRANSLFRRRTSVVSTSSDLERGDSQSPPFSFVILACCASPQNIFTLCEAAGLNTNTIKASLMTTSSFHLIGVEDTFKAMSEEFASLFMVRQIMYLPGGHGITREERNDRVLCLSLRSFMRTLGKVPEVDVAPKVMQMSEVSSVALLHRTQVALVNLNDKLLPGGMMAPYNGKATIRSVLQAHPVDKPFLYISRSTNISAVTTYGDVFNFINEGNGDLRRLGISQGEVVAYVAPPGGSAAAALAFLSIGSQTAATPLAPNTTEPDALDALDQFNVKHLILFEGIHCPGVQAAFEQYAHDGRAKMHKAVIIGNERPGIFEYVGSNQGLGGGAPLINSEDDICLLLRTSGTTARPKGVPLQQKSLLVNGAVLAKSMGLKESDICYSIMPLFHIGGISASILCTLTSGGAVSCDNELFDPSRMVDALAISNPQPTWYSSVPTIHNSTVSFLRDVASSQTKYQEYGINSEGVWSQGHSLRMIRSGAAALLGPDGAALATAYGGIPIYPTYSMSEQMPISQPPAGKIDTLTDKPGSVGVPIAASTAIVSRSTLRPQPYGMEGEIAISGPSVMKKYLNNPTADAKSYFYLTLPEDKINREPYFLTGDVGLIDSDGFLSLKGRAKELIKKGGEQVSPFEVEELLLNHPWVQTPVCFAVPSKLYGEEVGCALVLSQNKDKYETRTIIAEMRKRLKVAKLAPVKWPTKWIVCEDEKLPKTETKKYIRVGLSTHLGMDPKEDEDVSLAEMEKESKAKIDWEVLGGLRFCLACYVMFMHIGSAKSWGSFNNLRGWPWHVHVFFTLGGYSLASPMNPIIKKKFSYFLARIGSMYPMYALALIFGLINLLVVCRPSTFKKDFHWDAQPNDLYLEDGTTAPLFCEGTPATPNSYWASLFLTILTYIFGLAVTPIWPFSWWLGYYLWFSSMFYLCLSIFPVMYNFLYTRVRKNTMLLFKIVIMLLVLNMVILSGAWFIWKDGEGYNHYDPETGLENPVEEYEDGAIGNIGVLSFYLFGPFWMLYFIIGACTAFLYDAYRPTEKHNAHIWGWVADGITFFIFILSVALIVQGTRTFEEVPDPLFMRPSEADQYTDTASSIRLWDNIFGRLFSPLSTIWIFALSTGNGLTANFLRSNFLVETLSPNSYNCFLFHQMVGQWYYAATREGHMWNWWRYRKTMYWFSPRPCPVEWYEYFHVVSLVVIFSTFMTRIEPIIGDVLLQLKGLLIKSNDEENEKNTSEVLCGIIEGMTGIEIEVDWTLEECGLASIGVPVLVGLLNKTFSNKSMTLTITASDLIEAETILDMVDIVEAAKELAGDQGV